MQLTTSNAQPHTTQHTTTNVRQTSLTSERHTPSKTNNAQQTAHNQQQQSQACNT